MSWKDPILKFGDWLKRGSSFTQVVKGGWTGFTFWSFFDAGYSYFSGDQYIGALLLGIVLLGLGLMIQLDEMEDPEEKERRERIENLEERIEELEEADN